ncbi:MAG: hypothetical protein KAS90_01820 [Candidatus Aenigmarchaeota archaeon]|nr:hypothetical protein [Candidatus Aenigmarchaeota archaeon]
MGSVFYNLDECLRNIDERKKTIDINVGLRPSGNLHIGNVETLLVSCILSESIEEMGYDSTVHVNICDLDMPFVNENFDSKGHGYTIINYRDMPDLEGCHDSFSLHMANEIGQLLGLVNENVDFNYDFNFFSELQNKLDFRIALKEIFDNNLEFKKIFYGNQSKKAKINDVFAYPVCLKCKRSSKKSAVYNPQDMSLSSKCLNDFCENNEFIFSLFDLDYDLALHYFLNDALRDIVIEPFADIHVFGGDYSLKHSLNNMRKIEKVKKIAEIITPHIPDYFVGPLIQGKDCQKMGKSKGNGLNIFELIEKKGNDIIYNMIDFTRKNIINNPEYPKNDSLRIDYKQIKDILKID